MDRANIVIIGGGVVGCAIAMELAARWPDVFLLERMPHVGMASSTRNSGVLHSGIYYSPGSLKAKLCVEGNRLAYEFCEAYGVPHRATGKMVVAAEPGEEHILEELAARGGHNGVTGMKFLDQAAIRQREPHIRGFAALWLSSTGIVSAEELVKTYARLARDRGAHIVTNSRVTALEPAGDCIRVTAQIGAEDGRPGVQETIEARCVINCAGLYADDVAAMLGFSQYRIYPVRGEYCELIRSRSDLVRGLVYPLPHPEGMSLGVHLTKTLWDTVLVGPTARYVQEKDDYEKDRLPVQEFARMAQALLPELRVEDLRLAYSGLRSKLVPPRDLSGTEPGGGPADFVIARDPRVHAAIHLIGIESPGLTSALAIARYVAPMAAATL
ncbi:MAG TPA: FAD-dependent oxidoreductase [Candidatus Acidoferrales bacterium]|nr:FAD-dependent oxidoreductase [Candidatus Acidoferrales bacterium]